MSKVNKGLGRGLDALLSGGGTSAPQADDVLRDLLAGPDVIVTSAQAGMLEVRGLTAEQVGTAAWRAQLPIFELTARQASLEEAFMRLTDDSVDFRARDAAEEVAAR